MKGICSIGRVELNNKGLSSFAGGSVKILDNKNNIMMLIEGVIARRFEEKKNKNEKKINFKEKINKGLFNKEATQYRLFPISAESRDSLRDLASKLSEYVKKKNPKLDEMSNTLLSRHKNNQRFRAFVLARDLNELNKGLIKIANNEDIIENSVNNDENLAVFFSPQGGEFT
uniref:Cyclic nucleotide-binding domain-containing protein n=1 Tax=Meloidogyne hapla TaxID=6305 RepID=A0A1I8BC88_MELHA